MEMQLPEHQSAALAGLSARTGRSPDELVIEAIDRMLAEESWFAEQVQVGIDQIARGEFIDESEMDARVTRMLRR